MNGKQHKPIDDTLPQELSLEPGQLNKGCDSRGSDDLNGNDRGSVNSEHTSEENDEYGSLCSDERKKVIPKRFDDDVDGTN